MKDGYANEHWQDYNAEAVYIKSGIVDVSDMDLVAGPLTELFENIIRENPNSQLLINLSSGTPQMQIVLAQLAMSSRYNDIKGVQVSTPENSFGKSERTNSPNYSVETELELNEDELPGAPNRCSEPQMIAIQRDRVRAQTRGLLERRDYRALESIGEQLPLGVLPLVRHLARRNDLQIAEAYNIAQKLELPFKLYPARQTASAEYREVSEYYLLLRNLQLTGRYSEFVLRLNPFLTRLMVQQLLLELPDEAKAVIERRKNGRIIFNADIMRRVMPDEMKKLEQSCARTLESSDISLFVGARLLRILNKLPEYVLRVFEACEHLNSEQRNLAAHQLHAVTDADIKRDCVDDSKKAYSAAELVRIFGGMLANAYPDMCDKELFTVYDRCADYIMRRL
ncbi:MAG: type III-A CRISPR-associated CARF protein Csm6 [Christensenellales bacterium]